MYPLYHPSLLREYFSFGDFKKLCKILKLLNSELLKQKDSKAANVSYYTAKYIENC